jgi:hypothetical protein
MAFNFPDGASNGQTHTASNGTVYRYNGTTWVVDSASTTTNFDTRYLNSNGDGVVSGSVITTLDGTGVVSGSITAQLPSGVISGSSQLPSGLISSSTQITDGSGIVSGSVLTTLDGTGVVSGSVLRTLDGTGVVSGSVVSSLPTGTISGSTQITNLGYVSSSTADTIQIMTSASYATITPVSGTLYIIQG